MDNIIYLFRHGEVEYPLNDKGQKLLYGPEIHLSDEGRHQIEQLGSVLLADRIVIDTLYTSPFVRTVETADILSGILGVKNIVQLDELRDTNHPGYEETPHDDLMAINGNVYEHPKSPDQETVRQVTLRVVHAFKKIFDKALKDGKPIGIVGHGDPNRFLLEILKHPENGFLDASKIRDEDYLEKGTCLKLRLDSSMRILESEVIRPYIEGNREIERKF